MTNLKDKMKCGFHVARNSRSVWSDNYIDGERQTEIETQTQLFFVHDNPTVCHWPIAGLEIRLLGKFEDMMVNMDNYEHIAGPFSFDEVIKMLSSMEQPDD